MTLFSSIQTTTKFGPTVASKVSHLVCPSHPALFQGIISPSCVLFFVYAQRFDIVSQLPPTGQGRSNEKDPYPEPPTGMHHMLAGLMDRSVSLEDVVLLAPTSNTCGSRTAFLGNRRSKQLILEFSSEFWPNKYFEKELFYAFNCI